MPTEAPSGEAPAPAPAPAPAAAASSSGVSKSRETVSRFVAAASAASIAEFCTLPFDTVKVRLQLQNLAASSHPLTAQGTSTKYYGNPLQTLATIVKDEGVRAPFKGLTSGIHRQIIFTGLRLGMYDHVKDFLGAGGPNPPLLPKAAAALFVSGVGISCAQASDVVKVRYQASGAGPAPYKSAVSAYFQIYREEGVFHGLYKGYTPNLLRNSIMSACEILSYELGKEIFMDGLKWPDDTRTHLASGCFAGFVTTVIGSPWDVLGTRMIVERGEGAGLISVIGRMIREEGVLSFWKGFLPNFLRVGSFNVILWASYEKLKRALDNS